MTAKTNLKISVVIFCLTVIVPHSSPAAENAFDAVRSEYFSTFSICAIDPETGECGVAVTTRVPFVGRAVPFVKAGVGAVATQSWTVVEYGPRGLELMEQGLHPEEVIEKLLSDDKAPWHRQIGMINMNGESAAHTGDSCTAWAGSRQGTHYTVQANIMVGPEVVDAVANHFEKTEGTGMPLAERLILALEAGQAEGGDSRWGRLQSAAVKVADPDYPGRDGTHQKIVIEVGEHPEPVQEMKLIYYRTEGRLGWREFSEFRGSDVAELHRMLHALGYWRPELDAIPDEPQFDVPPEWRKEQPEKFFKAIEDYSAAHDSFMNDYGLFDEFSVGAVDSFRVDYGINFSGNPRGLVDQRLIETLRDAYYYKEGEEK